MARNVTLAVLKTRALERADLPLTTTRIDTSTGGELERWIQSCAAELWEMVVQHFGENYFFEEATLTTVSGQRYVALPTDHYKTSSAWWTPTGSTTPIKLDAFPEEEEFARAATPEWSASIIPRYRERGIQLYFEPTPDAVYSVVFQYVPIMTAVDSASNPFPGIHGWDDWIVTKVAMFAVQKDAADATHLERELGWQTKRVLRNAPKRDIHKKQHIRRSRVARWRSPTAVRFR